MNARMLGPTYAKVERQIARRASGKYARLEKALLAAEAAGDDVKVNIIAQEMAAIEGGFRAGVAS